MPMKVLSYPVAVRLSWAATRQISRGEDKAYGLIGILNLHMVLLYGEDAIKAFLGLQQEIIKSGIDVIKSGIDDSNYVQTRSIGTDMRIRSPWHGLLAPSVRAFRNTADVEFRNASAHKPQFFEPCQTLDSCCRSTYPFTMGK